MTAAECTSQTWHPPSLKSAFACCCYMCVPDTSPKLESTQGCHTPSISILSPSLALALFVACCANLESLLHREVRSWCHYQSIVHTQHSHPKNILRSNAHTHTQRGKKQRCSVWLLTVQIQVVNTVMLSEPFYQPLVQQHQTIKEKRNCQASPTGASYTNPVSWLNTAKITSKSFSP